jgi:broad specificity phosphatase PhoE
MAKRSSITLTLIRCGETTWDALLRVHGATDLPLSDEGRIAVTTSLPAAAACKATIVHHPADEAATETATIAAHAIGAKTRDVAELADPNLGLLEGLTEEEFAERFRSRYKQWMDDPATLSPPEGEDMAAAAERLFRAVAKIIERSRGEEIAVVLHDLGLSMLRCWLANRPLGDMRDMLEPEPRVERFVLPLALVDELEKASETKQAAS